MATRSGRAWTRRLAVVLPIAFLTGLMVALPGQALDGFESNDANLAGPGSAVDWNDFEAFHTKIDTTVSPATSTNVGNSPVGAFDRMTFVLDRTGNPDDIYGGGTKQDDNCPKTKDGSLGSEDNAKFDIKRLYLTHVKHTDGDDYLFLAFVRAEAESSTSSAHIGYEFNRGSTLCPAANTTGTGARPISRTAGDKLIVYDFEGGTATSTSPTLKLLTWKTSGTCEVSNETAPCWGDPLALNGGTIADAAVNTVAPDGPGPVTDAIPNPDATVGDVKFGEAGINLSEIPGLDPCDFAGHVTGVARSSGSSASAQMKDKVGPAEFDLPACVQQTSISTLVSLDDHATVANFDDPNVGDHTGDLTFTLYGPNDTDCDGEHDTLNTPLDPVYETTISNIANGGEWDTGDGDNTASSYKVPANAEGEYNWVVSFSGDSANLASSSDCGDEKVTVDYS